jgi:hypothetical protein
LSLKNPALGGQEVDMKWFFLGIIGMLAAVSFGAAPATKPTVFTSIESVIKSAPTDKVPSTDNSWTEVAADVFNRWAADALVGKKIQCKLYLHDAQRVSDWVDVTFMYSPMLEKDVYGDLRYEPEPIPALRWNWMIWDCDGSFDLSMEDELAKLHYFDVNNNRLGDRVEVRGTIRSVEVEAQNNGTSSKYVGLRFRLKDCSIVKKK